MRKSLACICNGMECCVVVIAAAADYVFSVVDLLQDEKNTKIKRREQQHMALEYHDKHESFRVHRKPSNRFSCLSMYFVSIFLLLPFNSVSIVFVEFSIDRPVDTDFVFDISRAYHRHSIIVYSFVM